MRPTLSGVCGFVETVAGREIGALQSFTAANVNDVRIGRRNGQRANGASGLVVENRIPSIAEIGGLPDPAVAGGHVENIRLVRHAGDGHGAASAEWTDAAPAHFGEKFLIVLLRGGRDRKDCRKDESDDEALPYYSDAHPRPPRKHKGYSGCGNGAMHGGGATQGVVSRAMAR